MSRFAAKILDQLADQIIAGEVVFFIGAGFSLDSENNSAERFMARLLVRFEAMVWFLSTQTDDEQAGKAATELHATLQQVFRLYYNPYNIEESPASNDWRRLSLNQNVKQLAKEYYPSNDWFCQAYNSLLTVFYQQEKKSTTKALANSINEFECQLYKKCNSEPENNFVPLTPIEFQLYQNLPSHLRGKALFLDTMGFADENIMAGTPYADCSIEAAASYRSRLKPRHSVLAQLAKEGLTPTLLTSNYDLLLEGAYRQAGFLADDSNTKHPTELGVNAFDTFSTIAGPTDFFAKGSGHQRALIVKIHGCASRYRAHRDDKKNKDAWEKYLKSMVFTYREIQNWRGDSWSRDYLSTLLRTRKMVFASYSLQDPVLHDTVRSVYEEIARQVEQSPSPPTKAAKTTTSAYYMGISSAVEFHGIEILRAASRIHQSESPSLAAPDNYLKFNICSKLPSLDEKMRWLFHRTYRKRQAAVLDANLRHTANMIFRRPCAMADIDHIKQAFTELMEAELQQAKSWQTCEDPRQQFDQVISWTEHFHSKMLREFVLAEALQHHGGLSIGQQHIRQSPRYFALHDHPQWAAWAVVIELALRKVICRWQDHSVEQKWYQTSPWINIGAGDFPQVQFAKGMQQPAKNCLTIRLDGNERPGLSYTHSGYFKSELVWDLYAKSIPWFEQEVKQVQPNHHKNHTPGAQTLWNWATAEPANINGQFAKYLEYNNG